MRPEKNLDNHFLSGVLTAMQFWKFSSQILATLLASVAVVSASGPSDGEATADPNSAVVKLTTKEFKSFLDENPLVLAEFYAPWCGYCKQLAPEFTKAADLLNETHPNIKLAQIDCVEEAELCQQHGIRGYPTLKVIRGAYQQPSDYEGPRSAEGIVEYMIEESRPPVKLFADITEFEDVTSYTTKPVVVQFLPSAVHESAEAQNTTFGSLAFAERSKTPFYSVEDDEQIKKIGALIGSELSTTEPSYLMFHPDQVTDPRVFSSEFSKENFQDWLKNAKVPYFGDINRDTYTVYMESSLPLSYYFYTSPEQRQSVNEFFTELGKKYVGKLNFVGLDASQYGGHAATLNMDTEIFPLFAIQNNANGRKYGINQTEYPEGPSTEVIAEFIESFLAGEVDPIVKSEPMPTQEEIDAQSSIKLVAHNYLDTLNDLSKDVFIEYYAPWCGHCKKLFPIWEELAEVYESKNEDSKVVIAQIDHSNNDVDTPIMIEGYPTIIFYPANGKINEKTGIREHVVYDQARQAEYFIDFIKKHGTHGVDGHELKAARDAALVEAEAEAEPEAEVEAEAEAEAEAQHDEL